MVSNREKLEALHQSDKKTARYYVGLIAASIVVVAFTIVYYTWPYPSVTSTGVPTISNMPKNGTFKTGDVLRWTTPEVCQPTGRTDATVYARLSFQTEYGVAISNTPLVTRKFDIPDGFPQCVKDNPTSAYIDGNLPTGVYDFEVYACSFNSGPNPVCDTFPGPSGVRIKRIAGNE